MRKIILFAIIILILLSFIVSVYYYPSLPEIVPIHWNATGEADGFAPKEFGTLFLPIIEIFIALLLIVVPLIDPKKENIKKFMNQYNLFVISIIGFFTYIHFLSISFAAGIDINIVQWLSPATGLLFYMIGIMTKHAKQNYSIGFRTPWTLANKKTWIKTHEKGALAFKISGIIAFFGLLFPTIAIWLIIVPIIISAIGTIIYSYFIYKKIEKK